MRVRFEFQPAGPETINHIDLKGITKVEHVFAGHRSSGRLRWRFHRDDANVDYKATMVSKLVIDEAEDAR